MSRWWFRLRQSRKRELCARKWRFAMNKPATADYPIHELIRERWSPRAFADKAVPADVLRSLFEAARWAPSSNNEQPWVFIVAESQRVLRHRRFRGPPNDRSHRSRTVCPPNGRIRSAKGHRSVFDTLRLGAHSRICHRLFGRCSNLAGNPSRTGDGQAHAEATHRVCDVWKLGATRAIFEWQILN